MSLFRSIEINGFRAFESFRLEGLRRVNLLVGMNGAGKTTSLEAIRFLASEGDVGVLRLLLSARGEVLFDTDALVEWRDEIDRPPARARYRRDEGPLLNVACLFNGFGVAEGARFELVGTYEGEHLRQSSAGAELLLRADGQDHRPMRLNAATIPRGERVLHTYYRSSDPDNGKTGMTPVDSDGRLDDLTSCVGPSAAARVVQYVGVDLDLEMFVRRSWSAIALTKDQEEVAKAMQLISSGIEGWTYIPDPTPGAFAATPGGIAVRLQGAEKPIPLGNLGEGMKRVFALALHLTRSAGGVLLVDEIDTGIHHSILRDVWRLVIRTAIDRDVQVFATTHSLDCLRALAQLCEVERDLGDSVSVHRIERGLRSSVRFGADELARAIEMEIEIR